MQKTTHMIGYLLLFLLVAGALPGSQASPFDELPSWDSDWSYRQEISLCLSTTTPGICGQPIDVSVSFSNPCWAENETIHSIRVCCWDGTTWHELESQIYNLDYQDSEILSSCSIVFTIPEYADGSERYFVYYDNTQTSEPKYQDHVRVNDAYYYASPLADISAEATYYEITEDGYVVYGVGQQGKMLDRALAQVVVKQKPNSEHFDILNADQIASFAFSYATGKKETDESSSDQTFISKKIFVDGNLMVSFGIISESADGSLRTTAVYKYYYSPAEEKRIGVHVKHETFSTVVVRGDENLDGRYGALISFKSRNPTVEKLNFGDIQPDLFVAGENGALDEYPLDVNPEYKERTWVISYADDVDLGPDAWLSYGDETAGKTHALIFGSSSDIVTAGSEERDGIQIKVAEKEYFNFLGTEVDYASLNFGRNSYEKGFSHDLVIPKGLIVEFDAELFSTPSGGHQAVQQEAFVYHGLMQCRQMTQDSTFEQEQKKYPVTVLTHLGGTRFTLPWLVQRFDVQLPVMWLELCSTDGTVLQSEMAHRTLLIRAVNTFQNVTAGTYLVKVYRRLGNSSGTFVGAQVITVKRPTRVSVFCSWERTVSCVFTDQSGKGIAGVSVAIMNNDAVVFAQNVSDAAGNVVLTIPYSRIASYTVKAWYRDFVVYDESLERLQRTVHLSQEIGLYDVTIEVEDSLGLAPWVAVHPTLSSKAYPEAASIVSVEQAPGVFVCEEVPAGVYHLQMSYGSFVDERDITIPSDGLTIRLVFSAVYSLRLDVFDTQGNPLWGNALEVAVVRDGKTVHTCSGNLSCVLPPAEYTVSVYQDGVFVGQNVVMLTSDQVVQVVTTIASWYPVIVMVLMGLLLVSLVVLFFLHKLSRSSVVRGVVVVLLIVSLIQPWWVLSGESLSSDLRRQTQMSLQPQIMIEATQYAGKTTYSLAVLPDVYVGFLVNVLWVLYIVCGVLVVSIVLDVLNQKRKAILVDVVGVLVLMCLLAVYYVGTERLCEASVGTLQGSGVLNLTIRGESVALSSRWGLGPGYLIVVIACIFLLGYLCYRLVRRLVTKKRL